MDCTFGSQSRVSPSLFFWPLFLQVLSQYCANFHLFAFPVLTVDFLSKDTSLSFMWFLFSVEVLNHPTAAALLAYLLGGKDRMWAEDFSLVLH